MNPRPIGWGTCNNELEYTSKKTGRIELDRALIEAAETGVPAEQIAEVLRGYKLGKITRREAAKRLRELAARVGNDS